MASSRHESQKGEAHLMKRYGNLFEKFVSMNNLLVAYNNARKGKTWQKQVQEIDADIEAKLRELQEMLLNNEYYVSAYKTRKIYEPKERDIYILPFYPDRIVHHALINVIGPIYDKLFIGESYACRKGKGQHRASIKCMQFTKRNKYVLQCDISKFYPSINHNILMKIVKRKIKDKRLLLVIERIIRSFPGDKNVPIGNFTSQWFGNLYMNEVDMMIKHELRIKDYIRYCDDFLLFGDNKQELWEALEKIKEKLKELDLRLSKTRLYKTKHGVDFVGYRHFPSKVLIRKSTVKRMIKNTKKYNIMSLEQIRSSIASTYGWLLHASSYNLINKVRCFMVRGLNSALNSKEDYLWAVKNLKEEEWRPLLQGLLDTIEDWFMIPKKEYKKDNSKYKKVVSPQDNSIYYYEKRQNPNAKLFRLGFTVEEVEGLLK